MCCPIEKTSEVVATSDVNWQTSIFHARDLLRLVLHRKQTWLASQPNDSVLKSNPDYNKTPFLMPKLIRI